MNERSLLDHITSLVDEERKLRNDPSEAAQDSHRLKQVEIQLDQCWDLLRQRRAKVEFGADPATASTRPAGVVEGYVG